MNATQQKLQSSTGILNLFVTAGFPKLDSLPVILQELKANGADLVEIGIPYSDPVSDGPTIQQCNEQALANGINLELIFEQLLDHPVDLPKVMMGYFNPVLQYGIEQFCAKCQQAGISGVIIPDLPIELYLSRYRETFEAHDLQLVFLVTPETPVDRIRFIDQHSNLFIYAVSSSSTTGTRTGIEGAKNYLQRLQSLELNNPVLVGFNISKAEDFALACQYAQGGIIGSAFLRHLQQGPDPATQIREFISNITQPTHA